MKILIDLRGIQTLSSFRGIGVLWRNILKNIAEIDQKNEYILLYIRDLPAADDGISYPENFRKVYTSCLTLKKEFFAFEWVCDMFNFRRVINKYNPDIVVLTTFAESIFPDIVPQGVPVVTWIYDIIPVLFSSNPVRRWITKFKVKYAANSSYYVISLSNAALGDILRLAKFRGERGFVVYPGVSDDFFKKVDNKVMGEILSKYKLHESYILYIGGFDPRKNLNRVIDAYSIALKQVDLPPLTVVGRIDPKDRYYLSLKEKIDKYGLQNNIVFAGFVGADDLPSIYSAAEFLVFPSLYEGFGLPIVESMATGCPVLTSNISSMPEVAGVCAELVNPYDVDSIANTIAKLHSNPELRAQLSKCGRERAKKFTWRESANKFLEIIYRVVHDEGEKNRSRSR